MREGLYRVQRHSVLVYRHQRHYYILVCRHQIHGIQIDTKITRQSTATHDYPPCFGLRFSVYVTAKGRVSNDDNDMMIAE